MTERCNNFLKANEYYRADVYCELEKGHDGAHMCGPCMWSEMTFPINFEQPTKICEQTFDPPLTLCTGDQLVIEGDVATVTKTDGTVLTAKVVTTWNVHGAVDPTQ